MKNAKKLTATSLIALLVFLSVSVILRSIALFNSFDWETMHFDNSALFTLSTIFVTVATFAFLSFIFAAPKKYRLAPDGFALETFIPSGILSVSLLFMSVSMLVRFLSPDKQLSAGTPKFVIYIPMVLTILAVLSAAFFLLGIMNSKRLSDSKASLGMCAVAFLVLYGSYLFFAKEIHPTNSPNKIIDQMAYFSSALFLLFETRISLGRDMWRPYVSLGLISALFCGYSSLPALILYIAKNETISDSITETVLTLAIFVYVSIKLLMTLRLPNDSQCKVVEAIEKMATERETEITEKRAALHAHEYNIMEENDSESESSDNFEDQLEPTEGQISFELDGSEG